MTLRRKMGLQITAMIVGLLLVSGASLWSIDALHQDYGVALEGYARLRQVYEAGSHLATAQQMLRMPHPQTLRVARDEIVSAATLFNATHTSTGGWDIGAEEAVRTGLRELAAHAEAEARAGDDPDDIAQSQRDGVTEVLGRIATLASGIRRTTLASEEAARSRRREMVYALAALCAAVVAAAVLLGVWQYRGVTRPLRRLSEGVKRVAAGQFTGRVESRGGKNEFNSLADDFNRMAGELDGLYHELERKVEIKSKELIRSERLASVGFLAAGVAHEINNPLGIISGYAEFALSEIGHGSRSSAAHASDNGAADSEVEKSLRIICDEAFRCKEITGKLLSLARPGEDGRRAVSLAKVARHVGSIMGGLRQFSDRKLVVHAEEGKPTTVLAVEAEMKQVLLNLTVNALEAAQPSHGEVRIEVTEREGWVEVAVSDNGRGMTPETVERVFEPFFSEKKGPRQHGTGLGLSITYAIIESHGGHMEATSDGPGKGSRFTLRMPRMELTSSPEAAPVPAR